MSNPFIDTYTRLQSTHTEFTNLLTAVHNLRHFISTTSLPRPKVVAYARRQHSRLTALFRRVTSAAAAAGADVRALKVLVWYSFGLGGEVEVACMRVMGMLDAVVGDVGRVYRCVKEGMEGIPVGYR